MVHTDLLLKAMLAVALLAAAILAALWLAFTCRELWRMHVLAKDSRNARERRTLTRTARFER